MDTIKLPTKNGKGRIEIKMTVYKVNRVEHLKSFVILWLWLVGLWPITTTHGLGSWDGRVDLLAHGVGVVLAIYRWEIVRSTPKKARKGNNNGQ